MKPKEWIKGTRRNGHAIPKLWIRNGGMFYAQMAVFNPATEKNVTRKICLDTKELKVAEDKLGQTGVGSSQRRAQTP